jgi:hypothetical protein
VSVTIVPANLCRERRLEFLRQLESMLTEKQTQYIQLSKDIVWLEKEIQTQRLLLDPELEARIYRINGISSLLRLC